MKQILVIGLEPDLVDFSTMPDMTAGKVRATIKPQAMGRDDSGLRYPRAAVHAA